MKKYILLPTVLILIGCLNKDAPSVNPFSQCEIFLELQLQSEIQFVGKWKVRRVTIHKVKIIIRHARYIILKCLMIILLL